MMVDMPDGTTAEVRWGIRRADGRVVEYTSLHFVRRYWASQQRKPGDKVVSRMVAIGPWEVMDVNSQGAAAAQAVPPLDGEDSTT